SAERSCLQRRGVAPETWDSGNKRFLRFGRNDGGRIQRSATTNANDTRHERNGSSMTTVHTDVTKRHDAVLLFDVSDGNPNGDPDAGNLPRVDPETMQGLVTDVAIKRKVRDFVDAVRGTEERYKIYVQDK